MTWAWSIPIELTPVVVGTYPCLAPDRLRVVVPTFRDWEDARRTVESLLACRPRPAEIVVVDDNGGGAPPAWIRSLPIHLLRYPENRGPAFARNAGARLTTSRPIEWLYFTDGGCEREPSFFGELVEASARMPRSTVAVAAPVNGRVVSRAETPINHYMTIEETLWPPRDSHGPQAIVTANAAVSRQAFEEVGGFRTAFRTAAGEDLDLGMRLRRVGAIGWASRAVVHHAFAECRRDFARRFERYGAGNAQLERLWGLPSLRAVPFRAGDSELQELADLQVAAMQRGYDGDMQRHACTLRMADAP
jgi:GT2 family glycosyltransferase